MTDLRRFSGALTAALLAEGRRIGRDRKALALLFAVPVVIASIVVFALSGEEGDRAVSIGWVATAEDPSIDRFVEEVVGDDELAGLVRWHRLPSPAVARDLVAAEEVGAAIVLAPATSPVEPAGLELVSEEDPLAAGIAATIIDEYRIGHAATVQAAAAGHELAPRGSALTMVIEAPTGGSLDAAVHWGPALGAFFVLLGIGHAAHRQVEDHRCGITGRLRSTPGGVAPVMIGRALAATGVGCASLLLMAATSQLLFGRAWGPWPQIVVVAAATAAAVAGVGAVIAAAVRTPGAAQSLTAVVSFGLGIAGGAFSPAGTDQPWPAIGRWLPTSLSLDAFGTATTTADWAALRAPVLGLLATGLVLLAVSGARIGRTAS